MQINHRGAKLSHVIAAGLLCLLPITASAQSVRMQDNSNDEGSGDIKPDGKGDLSRLKSGGNGIFYHGGPLLLGTPNIYYIWYGNWAGNSATTILSDFANSIGGSPYFNINTTYSDGSGTHVTNATHLSGSVNDSYSQGAALNDAGVQAVVVNALNSNKLPKDTNGVYFVLTSADVNETSGFCTQYCGWHTHGTIG